MAFKLRKVCHPDLNHFHRNLAMISAWIFQFSVVWCASPVHGAHANPLTMAPESEDCLYEPAYDSLILRALDQLYQMEYTAADSLLSTLPEIPARSYFRGLVLANRFNDLGDTASLFKAERLWDSLSQISRSTPDSHTSSDIYSGLTNMQLSYVASVTQQPLQATRLGRKAVSALKPLAHKAEASAYLALYDYYKATVLKKVDWLPFVHSDQEGPVLRLQNAAQRSRYLKVFLQTTLLWLYYDTGRLDSGLNLIDAFLTRYPKNRLYRQIKADFLFRKGDLSTARVLQEALQQEYAAIRISKSSQKCVPTGYLSSVGNLAKIYAKQNEQKLLARQMELWHSNAFHSTLYWLPSSLKKEVTAIKY